MKKVRTRYAPSPTGFLHIGGARSALYSYLFAKHYHGAFIVRIEDTDQGRNVVNGEASQLDNLAWLGIVPDESPRNVNPQYGPYRQSEKLTRYNNLIDQLLASGKAYKAYDTPAELAAQKAASDAKKLPSFRYDRTWLQISPEEKAKREAAGAFTVRLALIKNQVYQWVDLVRGPLSFNTNDIGDWVIRKQDGFPTYNFSVVVDDHDMAISHVLRGEEHISNTPKQLAIYDAFNWTPPVFGHLTIITNQAGKKLSKRDTSVKQFIEDYRQDGLMPQGIFNYLALLGWTHPQAQEVLTKQELIAAFVPERLSKAPAKFDFTKMRWFSKLYFQKLSFKELVQRLKTHQKSQTWLEIFVPTFQSSTASIGELQAQLNQYLDQSVKDVEPNPVLSTFKQKLNQGPFTIENITKAIKATQVATNAKGKALFLPLRLAITNQEHGPELAKAIFLVGEKLVNQRLAQC